MTTIEISQERGVAAQRVTTRSTARKALLACGVVSSLAYIATDIIGGVAYGDYSFTSQAISELAAIGSHAAGVVSPLYALYSVLVLAFGVAVVREAAAARNRPLTLTGRLLMIYAGVQIAVSIVGFMGSTFFNMHPRGAATVSADIPHIALTAVLVLLLLSMIAVGAFALGRRFRGYSFATLAIVIIFAALTTLYAGPLAAGQNTPGLGLIERINVYAAVIWPGALSLGLLRRSTRHMFG